MTINLDNYESFFLMYVDNELSATERKSVEEFLVEYPYLQEEMNLLKETVLAPEPADFAFKAGLLKPVIPEETLQENLLLHLDHELTGSAKNDLESKLMKDDKLQKEWALLKRTQLDSTETIVFPDIKSLYRHEKGRLVIGRFARWAVAAAFIAGGFFIGITLYNKQSATTNGMASNDGNKAGTKSAEIKNTGLVKDPKELSNAETRTLPAGELKENTVADSKKNRPGQLPAFNKNENHQPVKSLDIAVTSSKKQSKEKAMVEAETRPGAEPVLKGRDVAKINQPPTNEAGNGAPLIAAVPKSSMHTDTNIQPVENLFARNASLEAEEEISDNHIFMMDEEKISRTKAAGFLKKIKRTVERTTKIKPGNSLKIAGFEFAVK